LHWAVLPPYIARTPSASAEPIPRLTCASSKKGRARLSPTRRLRSSSDVTSLVVHT